MFGYVRANKMELKVKDYYKYRAFYCGLCNVLGERYGTLCRTTLTYDMTFLIILHTALYEEKSQKKEIRCAMHPMERKVILKNRFSDYAADMNIVLAYYNMVDDSKDNGDVKSLAAAAFLKKKFLQVSRRYPGKVKKIKKYLDELSKLERNVVHDCDEAQDRMESVLYEVDNAANCFGKLTSEIFVYRHDLWEESLRAMGFYLGKFIYIMDAYDDLQKDIQNGSYNPLKKLSKCENYDNLCEDMLTMMMAECCKYFERLPIIGDVEILRNILYTGVWNKWDELHQRKRGK